MEDLDKVMIAGQFGAHLPADSLVGTGIIPKEVQEKLVYVGNVFKDRGLYGSDVRKSKTRNGRNWPDRWIIWS